MRTSSYTRYAFWLVIPALFVTSFIVSASAAQTPRNTAPSKTTITGQRSFTAWSYLLTNQDGVTVLSVELNRKDNLGLRDYIQANAELAGAVFKQQAVVEGRVVFKQPLQEKQLPSVVVRHQDQVSGYELRIKGAQGEKFTIFGAPDASAFLPQDMIASFRHDIEHKTGSAELKGFTNVTMTMSAAEYQQLTNNPHVLFVDIAPAAAVEDARQNLDPAIQGASVLKQYAPAYWYHEESANP